MKVEAFLQSCLLFPIGYEKDEEKEEGNEKGVVVLANGFHRRWVVVVVAVRACELGAYIVCYIRM